MARAVSVDPYHKHRFHITFSTGPMRHSEGKEAGFTRVVITPDSSLTGPGVLYFEQGVFKNSLQNFADLSNREQTDALVHFFHISDEIGVGRDGSLAIRLIGLDMPNTKISPIELDASASGIIELGASIRYLAADVVTDTSPLGQLASVAI